MALIIRRVALSLAAAALPAFASGFADCPQHFPTPPPKVTAPAEQRELCFSGFAVLHSGQSKTPVYTVERLTSADLQAGKGTKRKDKFYPEARLPASHRAQLEDYKGSGYDRGHMVPAADQGTPEGKAQTFSLANMVPQAPKLNQGAWNKIEQDTRRYVERADGPVFVFTGPWFDARPSTIGVGRVWVPSHTWKVVYTPSTGRAWAYWMTNDNGPHKPKPIGYGGFVEKTGMAVLPREVRRD